MKTNHPSARFSKIISLIVFVAFILSMLGAPAASPVTAQEPTPTVDGDVSGQIVGGAPATPGDWPWQVALIGGSYVGTNYWNSQFCGGSLVSAQWVLTAAHCVVDSNGAAVSPSAVDVVAGVYDLTNSGGSQRRNVIQVVVHPSYNDTTLVNDIALLKMETPVTLGGSGASATAVVPLVSSGVGTLVDELAWVTGWGNTESVPQYPSELYEVQVPVISNTICNNSYGDILDSMLCAGYAEGGQDACQGDSGGPLVVSVNGQWQQAGIVSTGIGCAEPNYYGIYTRVSSFVDWVDDYVKPDLAVTGIDVLPPGIDVDIYANDDVFVYMYVRNLSGIASGAFTVNIYVDDTFVACSNTNRDYYYNSAGLSGSTSEELTVRIPAGSLSVGAHTITVYADSGCAITEETEVNNSLASASFTVNAVPVGAPVHDNVGSAKVVGSLPYTDTVDVRGATRHASDPTNIGCPAPDLYLDAGLASVWYRYTATADTTIFVDTFGSDYDTYITAWQGVPSTTFLGCNDDSGSGRQSALELSVTNGVTYYFEVAQFSYDITNVTAASIEKPSSDLEAQAGGGLVFHVYTETLAVSPTSLDFGDQLFRTSNPAEQVTIENRSPSAVNIGTLLGSSSVGTAPDTSKSFFIGNDTCSNSSLLPGEDCTFEVTFRPWSLGAKSGTVTIPSDVANQPHIVNLVGNSIAGTQLLLNRSFENYEVATGMPTTWSRSPLFKVGLDGVDMSWAFNGVRSVKFVGDGDLKIFTQRVDKAGGPGDDFSMFVVTKGVNIPVSSDRWLMQIMFYNGSTIVENRNVNLKTGTHEDNRITVMYTADTNYTHIMFRIHFGKQSGTAWVDLASLQWAP